MNSQISPNSERTRPPQLEEVEVSIFGPGKGECVVVHAGQGAWIVVDSCRSRISGTAVAIEYLASLGVNLATQVKLVIATHAHDDHFAGIADVFEVCESARLVCSQAATSEEYLALVEIDAELLRRVRQSAYSEYARLFSLASSRKGKEGRPIRYAHAARELWRSDDDTSRITALSPSDEAVTRARQAFATAMVRQGDRRRLSSGDPNEMAVALRLEAGSAVALLGADLPVGPDGCGWRAVLAEHAGPRASLFKVAHHGSPTSHHNEIWTTLLTEQPVQLLTPFRSGATPRPSSDDLQRLRALGPTYLSASTKGPTPDKALNRLRASLAGVATSVVDPWGEVGHVRARWRAAQSTWNVETFHPAAQV